MADLVEAWYSLEQYIGLKEDKLSSTTVDESLSSFKPMYCSREYQASTRLIQQYEKSTLSDGRYYSHVADGKATDLICHADVIAQ